MNLIEDLKQEEGFKGIVYKCSEGFDTIGFGTRLPITKEEATLLLEYRLSKTISGVKSSLHHLNIHDEAWDILYHLAYQIGLGGLLKFKRMIVALENQDYYNASIEMKSSLWAKQTPNRANRLIDRMINLN